MRWNVLYTIQGLLLASALCVTALWPAKDEPALLVTVFSFESDAQWQWIAASDASVLEVDRKSGRATVLANSQATLANALTYGLLPVRTTSSGCFAVETSKQNTD